MIIKLYLGMFQNVMKMFKLSICLRKKSVQRYQATCKNIMYHYNIMDFSTNIVRPNSGRIVTIIMQKLCQYEFIVYVYLL